MGEALYGSGKGYHNFVCVFGVLVLVPALCLNGRMYTGLTGTAGEIGV